MRGKEIFSHGELITKVKNKERIFLLLYKTHLKKHGVRYTELDVSRDQNAVAEMQRKSGQMGVPQTDINGEMIVGFDKSRINRLLGIQG